jgi:dienelactone hydrolase
MLDMWNEIGNKLIAMAQDFPEDKYDFKLQKDQRTFAENILHVASFDYIVTTRISGSQVGPDFGKYGDNPPREAYKTKADVVNLMQHAVADGAKIIQQQGDAGLDKITRIWRNRLAHNSYIWTSAVEHSGEHYGQLVVYYRANNLVPPNSRRAQAQESASRVVDLKASDGTLLKASYFAAAKPGPGVLLLHQGNRQRKVWDDLAAQLAAAGINTLTLDLRGFGESGGTPHDKLTPKEFSRIQKQVWPGDIDTALQYLVSQPGVNKDVIGLGGAGVKGVDNSVLTASRHSAQVKSLVLLSGETFVTGLQFLRQASQLPALFVVADEDEYPPTVEAMELLYITSSSPGKKLVHYAGQEPPWNGDEDVYEAPVPAGHGTDLFKVHPELPGIIVDWYVTTLIKTPGQASIDNSSAGPPFEPVIKQIEMPGGAAQVAQQLMEARRRDPNVRLWPEAILNIMGYDHLRAGETKLAVEVLKLNVTAYPDSADANDSLGDAYLANGEKDLARQYAEKALALLASDTKVSETRRNVIRDSAQQKLKQLEAAH